jgi:hypothetical protein
MLPGPRQGALPERDESELASSPWEWGVVIDAGSERDTIPVPALEAAEGDEDDILERA